jgi:integrase
MTQRHAIALPAVEAIDRLSALASTLSRRPASSARSGIKPRTTAWKAELRAEIARLPRRAAGPADANARLVLAWCAGLKVRPATLHHYLTEATGLLSATGETPLGRALTTWPREQLVPAGRQPGHRYFTVARQIFWFIHGNRGREWRVLPRALQLRFKRGGPKCRPVLTGADVARIIDELGRRAAAARSGRFWIELRALVLLLLFAGPRVACEALRAPLGALTVSDRVSFNVIDGKGGKARTIEVSPDVLPIPPWVLDMLGDYWTGRFHEARQDLAAPLFPAEFFSALETDADSIETAYQRIYSLLQAMPGAPTPHDFRRYFANVLRMHGNAPVAILNLLGHSTPIVLPRNYLQCYPALQRQQLRDSVARLERERSLPADPLMRLDGFARAQGISREGARKMLPGLGAAEAGQLRLTEATALLRRRILRATGDSVSLDARVS